MSLMADRIYAMVEHGFTLENIFTDHNYSIVMDLLGTDSARVAAMRCGTFKRKLNRYGRLSNSATHFVLHLLKTCLTYSKPKDSLDKLKHSIGKTNTIAWYYDEPTGHMKVYTSLYDNGQHLELLQGGLLLEWRKWKLCSVQSVTIGNKPQFNNVFIGGTPVTKESLYYSLKSVESDIKQHVDYEDFRIHVRQMLLNELCQRSAWTPAMDFLKHFTGDFAGIEGIFTDAIAQERRTVNEDLQQDDIRLLSSMIIRFITAIIESPTVRYMSEEDFNRIGIVHVPDRVIVYGLSSCLYYGYRDTHGQFYYLKMDDLRRIKSFLKHTPGTPLSELTTMRLSDMLPVIKSISDHEANKVCQD